MSLRVWLPLNGDLKNNGIEDVTITNNGATVDNNGKIGKCYYFNGSSYIDTGCTESIGTGDFTISVWVYITQAGKTYQCIVGNKSTGAASVGFALYWNPNQKKFLWSTADGTSATEIWSMNTFDDIIYDSWHHIVMIRNSNDSKIGYFYLDGIREEIASTPSIRNITSANTIKIGSVYPTSTSYYFTGKIDDLRIYDHALSETEIKKISQGLILHYPLNRNGFGQENLITQAMINADPWKSAIVNTTTVDGITGWIVRNYTLYNLTNKGNSNIFPDLTYEANTQYTLSVKWRDDYRTDGKSSALYFRFKYSDGTMSTNLISPKVDYWTKGVLISDAGKTVISLLTTYGNGGALLIADLKLEKGAKKTPYSPIVNSDEYNMVGLDDNIEYDISGFGNNSIATSGTLSFDSDTPKYNTSMVFNGSSYLRAKALPASTTTISFWLKVSAIPNTIKAIFADSASEDASGIGLGFYDNQKFFLGTAASNKYKVFTGIFIENEWNHIVIIKDSTSSHQIYCNGVLLSDYSSSSTNYMIHRANELWIGNRNYTNINLNGQMSDFRVYATALLQADIAELYSIHRS